MRHFLSTLLSWTQAVYVTLAAVWVLLAAWQGLEHQRVRESARAALINRSEDITTTLGLVVRSQQRRFNSMVSQERLESALTELVKSGAMHAIALLNATGGVVASAGPLIDFGSNGIVQPNERWDRRTVTLVNLVDLGASVMERGETNRPTIVLPRRDPNEPPPPPPRREEDALFRTNGIPFPFGFPADPSNRPPRPRFGRPPPMDAKEYQELLTRRGLHGLAITMSTDAFHRTCNQDLWIRSLIGFLATLSVGALALAWRNVAKSSELQMRLLRASELTTHLKEMNLAAAGLAHETRNPLNIIRGLAQMIGKQQDATTEIRHKTREIVDETDRVTAQLNEFINYSRPREVRRSAVALGTAIGEVVRALTYDLEEKFIRLRVPPGLPVILADDQMLRQALFNLLLNAVQAVERGGEIDVSARTHAGSVTLEIRDNGPGVSPDQRAEIFKPYFTTHQKGTGLGLAVVQQIVLAHGWEIECQANEPRGALFRISHIAPAPAPK